MTVTRCTLSPASELRKIGSVAASVLPSPVFISAIDAVVEHHAADQLDVEVAHVERAPAGLAAERERLVQQVVERLAVAGPLAQLVGLLAQLVVLEQLHLGLERVDARDALLVVLELARLAHAQGAVDELRDTESDA